MQVDLEILTYTSTYSFLNNHGIISGICVIFLFSTLNIFLYGRTYKELQYISISNQHIVHLKLS